MLTFSLTCTLTNSHARSSITCTLTHSCSFLHHSHAHSLAQWFTLSLAQVLTFSLICSRPLSRHLHALSFMLVPSSLACSLSGSVIHAFTRSSAHFFTHLLTPTLSSLARSLIHARSFITRMLTLWLSDSRFHSLKCSLFSLICSRPLSHHLHALSFMLVPSSLACSLSGSVIHAFTRSSAHFFIHLLTPTLSSLARSLIHARSFITRMLTLWLSDSRFHSLKCSLFHSFAHAHSLITCTLSHSCSFLHHSHAHSLAQWFTLSLAQVLTFFTHLLTPTLSSLARSLIHAPSFITRMLTLWLSDSRFHSLKCSLFHSFAHAHSLITCTLSHSCSFLHHSHAHSLAQWFTLSLAQVLTFFTHLLTPTLSSLARSLIHARSFITRTLTLSLSHSCFHSLKCSLFSLICSRPLSHHLHTHFLTHTQAHSGTRKVHLG